MGDKQWKNSNWWLLLSGAWHHSEMLVEFHINSTKLVCLLSMPSNLETTTWMLTNRRKVRDTIHIRGGCRSGAHYYGWQYSLSHSDILLSCTAKNTNLSLLSAVWWQKCQGLMNVLTLHADCYRSHCWLFGSCLFIYLFQTRLYAKDNSFISIHRSNVIFLHYRSRHIWQLLFISIKISFNKETMFFLSCWRR